MLRQGRECVLDDGVLVVDVGFLVRDIEVVAARESNPQHDACHTRTLGRRSSAATTANPPPRRGCAQRRRPGTGPVPTWMIPVRAWMAPADKGPIHSAAVYFVRTDEVFSRSRLNWSRRGPSRVQALPPSLTFWFEEKNDMPARPWAIA